MGKDSIKINGQFKKQKLYLDVVIEKLSTSMPNELEVQNLYYL